MSFIFFCVFLYYFPPFKFIFKRLICSLKPRCLKYFVLDSLLHATSQPDLRFLTKKTNTYFFYGKHQLHSTWNHCENIFGILCVNLTILYCSSLLLAFVYNVKYFYKRNWRYVSASEVRPHATIINLRKNYAGNLLDARNFPL